MIWDWLSDIPIFHWRHKPEVKTTPLVCIFGCKDPVTAVAYFPHGCTCHPNKYQPRCFQHMMRAYDTDEEMVVVEDFILDLNQQSIELGMAALKRAVKRGRIQIYVDRGSEETPEGKPGAV